MIYVNVSLFVFVCITSCSITKSESHNLNYTHCDIKDDSPKDASTPIKWWIPTEDHQMLSHDIFQLVSP